MRIVTALSAWLLVGFLVTARVSAQVEVTRPDGAEAKAGSTQEAAGGIRGDDPITKMKEIRKLDVHDGIQTVKVLTDLLERKDENRWDVRWTAVRTLAETRMPEAINPIVRALQFECSIQREHLTPPVERSAGTEDEAIEARTRGALTDVVTEVLRNTEVRETVLASLRGQLESAEDVRLKYHLALVLGKCGDKTAVPVLIECLEKAESGPMRENAAHVLGSLEDPSATPGLVKALRDDYLCVSTGCVPGRSFGHTVRRAAYHALKKLGVEVIDKGGDVYEVKKP